MEKILILLTSYNGERFINQMIDSVLSQDYENIEIILSDDGSTDSTPYILDNYAEKYPEKVIRYRSGTRFGNAQDHFMHLLNKFHNAPYIMFCDQDDVWHSDKVSKTYEKMKALEDDPEIPVLVHTDLRVVDGDLNCISPSFMHLSGIDGNRVETKQLLIQNVVTGCTMMLNKSLAKLAVKRIPESGIAMHDWWIALIASACGKTGFLNEATIDYRQHGKNSVGAKNVRSPGHILNLLKNNSITRNMRVTFCQAQIFAVCFSDILPQEKLQLAEAYGELGRKNWFMRKLGFIRYGFWKNGIPRKIGQLLFG